MLHVEYQPASLSDFVDGYWLVPFDGRCDDCLNETWRAGQSYGLEKLQTALGPELGR